MIISFTAKLEGHVAGPYFEPLSGAFLEMFCMGRVETESGQKWALLIKMKRAILIQGIIWVGNDPL